MMRRILWFESLIVMLLITGCSLSPGGEHRSSDVPPVRAVAVPALPHSGAPTVPNPLPRSVVAGSPCDAVTPAQLRIILGEDVKGVPGTLSVGPKCDWVRPGIIGRFGILFATTDHQGLSAVYENSRPQSRVWRPLPAIQGFPAVAHTSSGDLCDVSVGLADDLSVDIVGVLGDTKAGKADPCTVVAQAADLVVTTLRKKAGE